MNRSGRYSPGIQRYDPMSKKGSTVMHGRYVAYKKQNLNYVVRNHTQTPEIDRKKNFGVSVGVGPVSGVTSSVNEKKRPMILQQLITSIWKVGRSIKNAIRNFFRRKVKK